MAELFLSYKRQDLAVGQSIVSSLRASGVSVWWDQDIPPDAPWESTIEKELDAAKAVIVVWSEASVASESVKAEARRARAEGKLIQVFVESCEPPLFFGERQGVGLINWNGDSSDPRFQIILTAVKAVVAGRRPPNVVGYASKKRPPVLLATAGLAVATSVISIAANVGGTRDALCATTPLNRICELVAPHAPSRTASEVATTTTDNRAALLASVEGIWGNIAQDSVAACTTRISYSAETRLGEDFLVVRGEGFESVARVASAERGSIFTRTVTPVEHAGEQGEVRIEADRIFQVDKDNVATPLVRCAR